LCNYPTINTRFKSRITREGQHSMLCSSCSTQLKSLCFFIILFYFVIFTFTYMYIHYLGHLLPTPHLWAEPVLPSCSLIL
jgi:hypothetical protein